MDRQNLHAFIRIRVYGARKHPTLSLLVTLRYDSQYGSGLFNPSWPSAWLEPPKPLGTRKERDDDQLEQK